jgi:hypothetical protein
MKYLLLTLLVLCSCEYSGLDGDCTVEVSKKELRFSAEGGIDSVTSDGGWLWTEKTIRIGDTIVYPYKYNYIIKGDSVIYAENDTIIYNSDLNLYYSYNSDIKYITYMDDGYDVIYMEGPWFNIDSPKEWGKSKKKIIFSINKNETGEGRMFFVTLDGGDCNASINVHQSAE